MDSNIRIARELMNIAMEIASPRKMTAARRRTATKSIRSADELGSDIFSMCDPDGDRTGYWSWWLPNGMAFCVEWNEEDGEDYATKAVTSRTDDMGEAYGIYFIEDGELPDIWVGMSLDDAKKAAADIISWANDCRFESAEDAKQAVDEYYNGQFNKQELDEMVDEDAKTPDDMPLTFGQVKDWAFDNPDKLLKAANDVLVEEGLSSTFGMSVMFDIYREYLDTPQKYYGFDPSDQALFDNMCDCLYHGYGMDESGWESTGISRQEAKALWDKATSFMGDFD